MQAYCIEARHLSEDAAAKWIHGARAALRFPILFEAVADGRLHLTAVRMLAPHLTPENVEELMTLATHRSKRDLDQLLAERFPRREPFAMLQEITAATSRDGSQHAPGHVEPRKSLSEAEPASAEVAPGPQLAPLSAERYLLQMPIGKRVHDKLRYAASLMSHRVAAGDMEAVMERALDMLIPALEKQKFGATTKPRRPHGRTRRPEGNNPRVIPADVKRAVWKRDEGQCTFVGTGGHRCGSRTPLEFDHIVPVARGGASCISNLRLRCRAHNQYEAERLFGAGFMNARRVRARQRATESPARLAEANAPDPSAARLDDVSAALRGLGYRPDEARRALASTGTAPATTEEHLLAALAFLAPKARKIAPILALTESSACSRVPARV
jgi:5-methylcytosine-specific restriction endonuclease McrA